MAAFEKQNPFERSPQSAEYWQVGFVFQLSNDSIFSSDQSKQKRVAEAIWAQRDDPTIEVSIKPDHLTGNVFVSFPVYCPEELVHEAGLTMFWDGVESLGLLDHTDIKAMHAGRLSELVANPMETVWETPDDVSKIEKFRDLRGVLSGSVEIEDFM